MQVRTLALAVAAVALSVSPSFAKKVPAYAAGIYIKSTGGSGCFDASGANYEGVLEYAGKGASTDTLRVPLPSVPAVTTQVLNVTSGQGSANPSGTFTWKGVGPSGTLFNVNGNFSATVTTVDNDSYIFEITETYGSCTETSYIGATSVTPK